MKKYDDAGWLGFLPDTWSIIELGQVFEERNVKVKEEGLMPLSVTMNGIVPQLSSAVKAAEDSDRKLVVMGDYVINSRSDRKGACGVAPSDGTCSVINIVITPKKPELAKFYNYALLSNMFPEEFYRWGHGIASDLWTTRWQEMRKIILPNPPDSVKTKIVQKLNQICNGIEQLEKEIGGQIARYKVLKNTVIESYLTGGLTPSVNMKPSGERAFPFIPEHWDMLKIKRIFDIRKDIAGREDLQLLSITQRGIVPKDISRNEGQTAADYTHYQIIHVNDFAMNHMDLRTGWVDLSQYEGIISPDYRVFFVKDETKFCKEFYKYVMQLCYIKEVFYSAAQGINENGRYRLKTEVFLHFEVMVPPYEEQCRIAKALDEEVSAIDTLIAEQEKMRERLKKLRKQTIYDYVTGKKEVS